MDYVGHGLNFDLSGDVNEESYSPTQMKNFFRLRTYEQYFWCGQNVYE